MPEKFTQVNLSEIPEELHDIFTRFDIVFRQYVNRADYEAESFSLIMDQYFAALYLLIATQENPDNADNLLSMPIDMSYIEYIRKYLLFNGTRFKGFVARIDPAFRSFVKSADRGNIFEDMYDNQSAIQENIRQINEAV